VIYLFSQIAISLILAAIVGGAIGWLIHRATATKNIRHLHDVVNQQQQQVNEAQNEVSIITADFDDLKQSTQTEIGSLKSENQQIPALHQNLEKSQLLVRQMMEQHKTELDEINEENEKLLTKARQIDDRENQINKLQTELDDERRNTNAGTAHNANLSMQASSHSASTALDGDNSADTNFAENLVDSNDETLPNTAQAQAELKELRDQLAEEMPSNNEQFSDKSNFVEVSPESTRPHKLTETEVDDTSLEQMFDSVDQHDDLKQIFGIGPVTEKTLNKLGITAYAQLAELKQHDIEKIANALQIFPGSRRPLTYG